MKQRPSNNSYFDSVENNPAFLAEFCSNLKDSGELDNFIAHPEQATKFLESLQGCRAQEKYLVQILCMADVIFHLVEAGNLESVWKMIKNLEDIELQVKVLSAAEVVFILTKNGKANQVRELIQNLPTLLQLQVCLIPYAVFGMAKFGHAEKTLELILSLPKNAQASVLSTSHVMYGLIDNLNSQANQKLLKRIQTFPEGVISEILASHMAVFGLVKNGRTEEVLAWLRDFSPEQLEKVLNAAYVLPILNENVSETEMSYLMTYQLQKREDRNRKELMSIYRSGNRNLH